MNDVPPNPERPEDLDDFYRRASVQDASRPGEATRRAVLAHAERVVAERQLRAARRQPTDRGRAPPRWWHTAVLGTLGAAALAALVVAPRWLALWRGEQGHVVATPDTPATPPAAAGEAGVPAPAPAPPPVLQASESRADFASETAREAQPSAPARAAKAPIAARQAFAKAPAPAAHSAAPARAAESPQPQADEAQGSGAVAGPGAIAQAAPAGAIAQAAPPGAIAQAAPPAAVPPSESGTGEALRRAAETGDLPQLEKLLQGGIDLESRDGAGRTALMRATLAGNTAAVELLLVHGADPNAADAQGTTPLEAARTLDFGAVAEALRHHGAR
jgi:hypothetical protein